MRQITTKAIERAIVARYDRFVDEHDDFPDEVYTIATKSQVASDLQVSVSKIDGTLERAFDAEQNGMEALRYGYYNWKKYVLAKAKRGHFIVWEYGNLYLPWPSTKKSAKRRKQQPLNATVPFAA